MMITQKQFYFQNFDFFKFQYLLLTLYNQSLKMIQRVPLNAFISFLYFVAAGILLVVLKIAVKSQLYLTKASKKQLQKATKTVINYDKLLILSWLQKYTLIGSCFIKDKKFLLKEFLFISVYAVTCLNINHLIVWPLGLSTVILVVSFLFLQLMIFKYQEQWIEDKSLNRVNVINTQVLSQAQIYQGNIQQQYIKAKNEEQAKFDEKKPKTLVQIITITSLCFASIVMMLQTAFSLANSLSNSGQLNILSVLAIVGIDQLALRPLTGGLIWVTYKIVTLVTEIKPEQLQLVQYLCSQEITCLLVQNEHDRLTKFAQMTASPPKRKAQSPSKVPKALALSADRTTYLNLISIQPTKRQNQAQDEHVENIYLTTAEKELFQGKETLQNKSTIQTRRKINKENKIYSFSAAQKDKAIELSQNNDLFLIKDDPLHEVQNNHVHQFCIYEGKTRRKEGYRKKKNQRNLKLTGSSPYLEYLPDMLKKVDKYNHDNWKKQKDQTKISRKLL